MIGIGCFAKVKLAKWTARDGKPCALKIVNKKLAIKLKQANNLVWERRLLSCITNPYFVKWY